MSLKPKKKSEVKKIEEKMKTKSSKMNSMNILKREKIYMMC